MQLSLGHSESISEVKLELDFFKNTYKSHLALTLNRSKKTFNFSLDLIRDCRVISFVILDIRIFFLLNPFLACISNYILTAPWQTVYIIMT